jgi:RNA polymerase sigma-54 factor
MAISQRLDLRQSQSLVMTPQLQQAIKLLQLSNLELTAYVEQELERNPLLQRDETADGRTDRADGDDAAGERLTNGEATAADTLSLAASDGIARDQDAPLDTDYDNMWNGEASGDGPSLSGSWGNSAGGQHGDGDGYLEHSVSEPVTLQDHLLDQINVDIADAADRIIATNLIHLLDDAGYLAGDWGALAETLGCDRARIETTIARLQQLDPPGIFARDLKECLSLQLRDRNRLDPAMQALIQHLELLAKRDRGALMKICGVDEDDLAEMIAEIKALNPKPAMAFDRGHAQPIVPDVLMRPDGAGGWIVELNQESLPRVLVDNSYFARVNSQARKKTDREYLTEQMQSANWLVKALHQRATTILKVAGEIVRQQDRFFAHGVQHLRPLILRDIAAAIGMHESTVSRVTTNKYLATPRGIYELKYFFTTAIQGTGGAAAHSAEAVRFRIKSLIDRETPDGVLSDDTIVDILRKDGVDIARRTVAKYREALRIPSSVQRRRDKTLSL